MRIYFGGKVAQEHPLHRLEPGVNDVPDPVGRRLRQIAKAGKAAGLKDPLPVRDATPAEERAFDEQLAKRAKDQKAADDQAAQARKDEARANAAARGEVLEEDELVDDVEEPKAATAAAGKAKA